MNKYEKYKDSGIEWIGEIPEHWEVKKIKYISKLQGGYAFKSDLFCEEGIPIIRIGDINSPINWSKCKKVPEDLEVPNDFVVKQFDTLIALSGATTGKTTFINTKPRYSFINQRVAKVGFYNKLLYFNISGDNIQKLILLTADGSAQENISNSQIENLDIVIPPTPVEQTAIANYLDRKTAQIDELIADKKRLLELYVEEKTAIINQAVTKGLTADGKGLNDYADNNKSINEIPKSNKSTVQTVKMKDSGIDWLGEIPEHWEVKKLKYVVKLITEKSNGDYKKVGLENIESNSGSFIETNSEFQGEGIKFQIGDILYGKLRPYLSKVFLSDFEGAAVGDFFVLRPNVEYLSDFIKYRLLSSSFTEISNSSTYGSKMPRVSWEFMSHLFFALPKNEEQTAIVQHIETEINRINTKVEKTKKLIDLLGEYKQSLISEVVTGKIKVI